MIPISRFPVEPWHVRELGLEVGFLAQSESIFALSNGHIGLRGNLDEGDPAGLPGTYLNSFFESRPLPYAEAGYGFPESGQTVVNVTDGKLIRLLVDDEPMDIRYGEIDHHERILDLRGATLRRVVQWTSPAGQTIRVRSTRLVSLSQRSIAAIQYSVEPVGSPARVVLQSELVANEHLPRQSGDPRVAAALEKPLEAEEQYGADTRALLLHQTRASQLRMGAAMDHIIDAPNRCSSGLALHEDWARLMVGTVLQPGERLTLTKFLAYGWSGARSLPALRDQVEAALVAAVYTGFDDLVAEQRAIMDDFWHGADVELDGDPSVQQAVRFGLFHTFQAAARAEQRAIPAKGLTGPGYDGHAFWDTEQFVLPVLTATAPKAAADALRWRWSILDMARERAHTLDLRGATFPWRTIRGQETSGYWPAGTAAVHVNADVALAVSRHVAWTGDDKFEQDFALPILLHTARLWMSLGYHGSDGKFHIDGVTGPDEYSALVDDNVYTNLMAKRNLLAAAATCRKFGNARDAAAVCEDEIASWEAAATAMAVPFDEANDVYQQDKGFTEHEIWDFERSAREQRYPLLLHYPYFELYRKQVIKQADLILAMHWCGDEFSWDAKAKAFYYYDRLTVRDSSLSACTQAVIAAETGHLELAYEYLTEAALMDLHDLEHNTGDGLHIASLAGAWIALVAGFGGMRDFGGRLAFRPQLPSALSRLGFSVRWRGFRVCVTVQGDTVCYVLEDGPDATLEVLHDDQKLVLRTDQVVTAPACRVTPATPRPSQPAGRAPAQKSDTENLGDAQDRAEHRSSDLTQGA